MLSKKKLERYVKKKKTEDIIKELKDLRYNDSRSMLEYWKDLLMALARIGDPQVIKFIINEVRYLSPRYYGGGKVQTIADALKMISGDSAHWLVKEYKLLKELNLIKDGDSYPSNIAEVLKHMGQFAVDAMLPFLDDTDDWWMFKKAIEMLARSHICDKRVEEKVLELFESDNLGIKHLAIDALGEMRSKAAVPILVDLYYYGFYKTDLRYARIRAQEALEKIGKPAVLPLIDLLGYAHGDQLSVLFSMLGKIGDRRAVAPIRKCKCEICTPEYDSQKDALKALGENVVTFDDVSR